MRIPNSIGISGRNNFPINSMKTTLIASLFSVTIALSSFGQPSPANQPPPNKPPVAPPTTATSPATAPANTTTAPAPATSPATTTTTTTAPGATATVAGLSPAPGTTPSTAAMSPATTTSTTATSPAAAATPSAAPTPEQSAFDKNFFVENFRKGGPIMWPILIVSIVALTVVIERSFWWLGRWMRRDPKKIEKVFTA